MEIEMYYITFVKYILQWKELLHSLNCSFMCNIYNNNTVFDAHTSRDVK